MWRHAGRGHPPGQTTVARLQARVKVVARLVAAVAVLMPRFIVALKQPNEEARRAAIGDLSGLPAALQKAFASDNAAFQTIPAPHPNDWLAVHEEPGQTFSEFTASQPNRPSQDRHVIYLQPLGSFAPKQSPPLDKLRGFAAAFFTMDVKVLPPLAIEAAKFTTRRNPYAGNVQILTSDVLNFLKSRVPSDAFCILAITMEDLYPEASWNFVFGQVSLRERVGIYSFARYDPAFYGEPRRTGYETLLLRRSCKVLAHEAGHMFGLAHCTYFNCPMNGSNHLAESDRRPLHLCPVCLRKLQWSISFDVRKRYIALERVERGAGFVDEAEWLARRIKALAVD